MSEKLNVWNGVQAGRMGRDGNMSVWRGWALVWKQLRFLGEFKRCAVDVR